jgi:hypothetical protein
MNQDDIFDFEMEMMLKLMVHVSMWLMMMNNDGEMNDVSLLYCL